MSYISQIEFDRVLSVPIALPETELRRQNFLTIGTLVLEPGQRLELCCLHLQIFKLLSFGVSPLLADSSLGLCSVGLLTSTMFTSALGLTTLSAVGTAAWNQDQPVIVTAPGTYAVQVYNNSTNMDLSVVVTGAMRLFYA